MRRHSWAASAALTVLAAMGLDGSAAAAEQVPFRGSFEGSADASAFPSVVLHMTGSATQLGTFTFTEPHVVNPATATGEGTFEFVAANGDRLVGTVTGFATVTSPPNVLTIVETATITGGTGRFAGASGGFSVERIYDRSSGATAGSFAGTISIPGSGN